MPPSSGSVSGDEAHPNQTGPMLGLVADPSAPGAGHLPERARLRLRPRSTDRALEGLPSPQPTVQLADRSSDVERVGGEQPEAALGRPSIREGRVSVVPRSEPAIQPTDAIDVDAIVRARTPVTSSASPIPPSNLPGSASSLRAVHAPTSASTPAESARARTAAAAGTPTHSLLDALDPNIERTLTTLLRNAARRHGIDV